MASTLVFRTIRLTRSTRLAQRVGGWARGVEALAPFAALGLIGLGVVGLGAQWRISRDPAGGAAVEQRVAPPPAESAWSELAPSSPALKLDDPRFAGAHVKFSARRRDDEREDVLTLGGFDDEAPYALFVLAHSAAPDPAVAPNSATLPKPAAASSFYVEIARRAAPLGLSLARADLPVLRDSRLGPTETAGLILAAGPWRRQNCRGLRLGADAAGVTLTGLVCLAEGEPFSERDLLCLLDALAPAAGVDLGEIFVAAARRPALCAAPIAAPLVAAAAAPGHKAGGKPKRVAGKPRPR